MHRMGLGTVLVLIIGLLVFAFAGAAERPATASETATMDPADSKVTDAAKRAREPLLPLPSTLTLVEYEKILYPFIRSRDYAKTLGWIRDKGVRDTGPYVRGTYFGTHPAVRIYYSPKVLYWMTGDPDFWPEGKASGEAKVKKPREGAVPDGGMIVKEMFHPPAARYEGMSDDELVETLFESTSPGWTVMVKDAKGAPDGWFWASVWVGQPFDMPDSLEYLNSGFGLACVRCHAVAEEGGTFAALRNIEGFSGDPLTFFVDNTWKDIPAQLQPYGYSHGPSLPEIQTKRAEGPCLPNDEFIRTFDTIRKVCIEHVREIPSEANDHVVMDPNDPKHFLTSDQCMMCHSGANSKYAFGPTMFLETKQGGFNVSPYGEWRWSPMGLAGRDPVFYAQLESEVSQLKRELGEDTGSFFGSQVVNTCLTCHGAMGKRQHDIDMGVPGENWSEKSVFDLEWLYITDPKHPKAKYAALARDGISCTVCHHMQEDYEAIEEFLANSITGQFTLGPADEIYGPFEDVITKPMEGTVGLTPKHNPYIQSSRMCASCHIISLPVVDWPLDNPPDLHGPPQEEIDQLLASEKNPHFKGFLHNIEQATYLEWLNSKYQDEFGEESPDQRSCQDCHMPDEFHTLDGSISISPIKTKIATIEDETYPEADHRIPTEEFTVKTREEGFRRHNFQGLNIFLAEMFRQFNDVLGVRKMDYETGSNGLDFSIQNYVQNAREKTAKLEIVGYEASGSDLEVDVKVTNFTGHRLPSGVGFRRVFIEFIVMDDTHGRERVLWASGRTNGVGVMTDWDGNVLPEEFFTDKDDGGEHGQHYHKHHQVIDSQSQVQVYEELAQNAKGRFTTSFIHRAHHVKDNRLLPMGWTAAGPSPRIPSAFVKATHPYGVDGDPAYADGSGTDVVKYKVTLPEGYDAAKVKVRATLYSQSWAPYYLKDRFTDVPDGPEGDARRRLYYLTSHLDTEDTEIEDWKFELSSVSTSLDQLKEEEEKEKQRKAEEAASGEGKGCG